jgi:predicted DNA-binding ribbon-helix-helix protein
MRSSVVKRTVIIGGHKTGISLEDAFWTSLAEIAASRQSSRSDLLTEINGRRQTANLSSAIRLFVLQFFQDRAREAAR